MRRLTPMAVVLVLSAGVVAQSPPIARPAQVDGVVRLLAGLEGALVAGDADIFERLTGDTLPAADRSRFMQIVGAGPAASAVIRERARRPIDAGLELITEVLVGRGLRGRFSTWQLEVRPKPGVSGHFELVGLDEMATLEGLLRLSLDTSRQFDIRNLVFRAPDLTLEMFSGSAFVADSGNGVTALVLRGRGDIRFAPPSEAEQGQIRIFSGKPAYSTEVDSVFIRISPLEYTARIADGSLVQRVVDPAEQRRAQAIFDLLAPRTYNLDLQDMGPDSWSLEPSSGSVVVEFRSRRDGWLTYAQSPSEPEDISLFDRRRGRNISIYASEEKLADRGPFFSEDDDRAYDLQRIDLDLAFDPSRSWISGRGSMRIRVTRPLVSTLSFKLAEPLTVFSVTSAEFGRLLMLRIRGQNRVLVSLPRPQPAGAELVLEVTYGGRLPPQQLDREALAVSADAGAGQEQGIDGIIVTPEPRFMYSNRTAWYPQGETTDYATATLRLSVPAEYQIVATGTFTGSTIEETPATPAGAPQSRRTVEYAADRPVRYVAAIFSRFVSIDRREVAVPAVAGAEEPSGAAPAAVTVEVVSTPRMASRNRSTPDRVANMLGFYAKTMGGAPYPGFTMAALDDNLPGGHSPPYFVILHQPLPSTPFSWTRDPVSFDLTYPDFFLAHEVAHQWWGQAVGWKNYHEQWLSEGLAQYFAVLYAGFDRGPETTAALIGRMRDSSLSTSDDGPIFLGYRLGHLKADGRVFRSVVYNKSAVVLHMLRRLIGDDAFFGGLREFYETWRFRKAGTGDLRDIFARHASMSLDRFFDRWIVGSGIPRVRVRTRFEDAGRTAVVRVEQLGDVFDLPLAVAIQYADGRTEIRDIRIGEATSEHRLTLDQPARRVEVRDNLTLARLVR